MGGRAPAGSPPAAPGVGEGVARAVVGSVRTTPPRRMDPREAARAQLASARPSIPVADTSALGAPSLEAARRLLATVEDARAALLEVASANLPPARARAFRDVAARPYDTTPVLVRVRRMRDAARAAEREVEDAARVAERARPSVAPVTMTSAPASPAPEPVGLAAPLTTSDVEIARLAAVRAEIARVEAEAAALLVAPPPREAADAQRPPETGTGVAPDPVALAALAVQLLEQGVPRELVLRIVGFGGPPAKAAPEVTAAARAVAPPQPVSPSRPDPAPAAPPAEAAAAAAETPAPSSVAEVARTVAPATDALAVAETPGADLAPHTPAVAETPVADLAPHAPAVAAPSVAEVALTVASATDAPAVAAPSVAEDALPVAPATDVAVIAESSVAEVVLTVPDAPVAPKPATDAPGDSSDAGTLAAWGLAASEPPVRASRTSDIVPASAEPPAPEVRRRARLVPIGGAAVPPEPVRPASTAAPEVRFQGTGPGAHEEPQGLRGLVPAVRFPGPDVPRQTARAEHGPGFVAGVRWGDLPETRPETTTAAPEPDEVTEPVVTTAAPLPTIAPVKTEYTLPERGDAVTLRPVDVVRIKGAEAIVLPPVVDAPRGDADDIELDPWFDEAPVATKAGGTPARTLVPEADRTVQEATLQVRLHAPQPVAEPATVSAAPAPTPAPARSARVAEANTLAAQGRLDAAADVWDAVLAQAPDDVDSLLARGLLHLERSDFEAAGLDLERARSLAPESVAPLYGLGDLAFARKAYADAIGHYDAGLARVGAHGVRDAMALCRRGLAHHYLRDWTRAVEDLEAARLADPDIPHVATFANMARARARGRG